jgi:hypothetical protein
MPDESEFLCGDWMWDASLRELRHFPRRKKGHADEPDATERLEPAKSVTLYLWSQQPMMSSQTGDRHVTPNLSRLEVEYADGRKLTINEGDRDCVRKLAGAIAAAYGLDVREEGAPTGRRGGNLPTRDEMGRLRYDDGRVQTTLDEATGELRTSRRKKLVGKTTQMFRTSEIRRLELAREVKGPIEAVIVYAIVGPEETAAPVAGYSGFEGWAEIEEWRGFTAELARSLGTSWVERGASSG